MVRLKVKEILAERGISMSKLSRMSDISFSTINRICNDPGYSPTVHTLEQLAKALGLHVADLLEEVPDPPEERR
ncbi:helix-turn-helix domain-containing protein [Thermogemmatispora sp.]|jgi:putative transcriptional regulator|uniref:helix-turn-helix domain-containing protein n=1 Tax=Thermogemmatispora sp. TaxID=1968838 RepID=UPI0035E42ACB